MKIEKLNTFVGRSYTTLSQQDIILGKGILAIDQIITTITHIMYKHFLLRRNKGNAEAHENFKKHRVHTVTCNIEPQPYENLTA